MDYAPQKISVWYDDIIEWLVTHPGADLADCARDLNRGPAYIQALMRNDFMKARLEKRRAELREHVNAGIAAKASSVALKGLTLLEERFTTDTSRLPTTVIAETTKDVLSILGFSPKRVGDEAPNTNVQVTVSVTADMLAAAREKMRTIEGTTVDSPSPVPRLANAG